MKNLDTKELTKLSQSDLVKKLNDLRSELSKLRSGAARGTLKKELGEIKTVRRNIARVLTVINGDKNRAESDQAPKGKQSAETPVEKSKAED